MSNELTTQPASAQLAASNLAAELVEKVLVDGDLSKLAPAERLQYYKAVCESVGLNPLTKPFEYIHLNGKLRLYALKGATDQLRNVHGISIERLDTLLQDDLVVVTATAKDRSGRIDSDTGAVPLANLKGEAKANAIMKAITKAKRRVTLSMVGLGMLDESEVESIPGAKAYQEPPQSTPAKRLSAEVISEGDGLQFEDLESDPIDADVTQPSLDVRPITAAQLRRLHTVATNIGVTNGQRDHFRAFISDMVGRPLASSKDLTLDEANMLLNHSDDEMAAMLDAWQVDRRMTAEAHAEVVA